MQLWHAVAASTGSSRVAAAETMVWLGCGMALFLLAVIVGAYVRRRYVRSEREGPSTFTLDGIRRLRDLGELTVPEYETLRQRIIREAQCGGAAGPREREPG